MARKRIEEEHQAMVMAWMKWQYPDVLIFAIPNGGSRHPVEARNLRLSGVTAGVPDLMLAKAANGLNGLFIEMKKPKVKGERQPAVSKSQQAMIAYLIEAGYGAMVCYGFDEARDAIVNYLNQKEIKDEY